jgi:hypothetical protein
MEASLRLTQSLGEIETESGVFDLFAAADASYDKETSTVVVRLNSYLLLRKAKCPKARLFADSIIGPRTVTEEAAEEKYAEVVNSIFANWVQRLEQSEHRSLIGPSGANPTTTPTISFRSPPPNPPVAACFAARDNWAPADSARGPG